MNPIPLGPHPEALNLYQLPSQLYIFKAPNGERINGWHHQYLLHALAVSPGWREGDFTAVKEYLIHLGPDLQVSQTVLSSVAIGFSQLSPITRQAYANNLPSRPVPVNQQVYANNLAQRPPPLTETSTVSDVTIPNTADLDIQDQIPPFNIEDYLDLEFLEDPVNQKTDATPVSYTQASQWSLTPNNGVDNTLTHHSGGLYETSLFPRSRSRSPGPLATTSYRQRDPLNSDQLSKLPLAPPYNNINSPWAGESTNPPTSTFTNQSKDVIANVHAPGRQEFIRLSDLNLPTPATPMTALASAFDLAGLHTNPSPLHSGRSALTTTVQPAAASQAPTVHHPRVTTLQEPAQNSLPDPAQTVTLDRSNSNASSSKTRPSHGPGYIPLHEAANFIANFQSGDILPDGIEGHFYYCNECYQSNNIRKGCYKHKYSLVRHHREVHFKTFTPTELPEPDRRVTTQQNIASSQPLTAPATTNAPLRTTARSDDDVQIPPGYVDSGDLVPDAGAIEDPDDRSFKPNSSRLKDVKDDDVPEPLTPTRRSSRVIVRPARYANL